MKTRSLVRQATVAVLAIEVVCALCFAGSSILHEWHARIKALDVTLEGRSDSLVGAIQDAEDPEDNVKIDAEEFSAPPRDVYAVYSPNGRIVGASNYAPSEVVTQVSDGFRDIKYGRRYFRVLQRQALRIIDRDENGGAGYRRPVVVVYAIQTNRIWNDVMEATRFYLFLSLGLILLSAVLLIFVLRRLLRPINELASRADAVSIRSLQFSPPESALHIRELRPLAEVLSQTMTRLRAAFEMEKRFISDAAHELKTAVAVVRSSVQVLTMRNRSVEEYQGGLEKVLLDNGRVEDLVSRMLTLARFEERSPSATEVVDLAEQIETVMHSLSSLAEARGVILEPSLAPGVPVRITSDAASILGSNLIMNAIQHSPRGAVVMVTVKLEESGERQALFSVLDFGSGISDDSLPHVFERFFREDPSRSRETGGAGLGLAICKSIVENADGSIEMHSRKDEGTLVTVTFRQQ